MESVLRSHFLKKVQVLRSYAAQKLISDAIKPVFENGVEPALQWQPGVIGGQLGHIVGVPVRPPRPTFGSNPTYPVTPARPSNRPQAQTNNRPEESQNDANRKPSPRHINNNNSIIGSFFDLFSK